MSEEDFHILPLLVRLKVIVDFGNTLSTSRVFSCINFSNLVNRNPFNDQLRVLLNKALRIVDQLV